MTDDITRLVRFTSKGLDEVLQAKNQGLKGEITHIGAGTGRDAADVAFATIFGGVKTQAPVISAVPVAGSPTPIHSAYALSTDAGVTAG